MRRGAWKWAAPSPWVHRTIRKHDRICPPTPAPPSIPHTMQRAICESFGVVINVVTSDLTNWFLRYIPHQTALQNEIFLTYIAPVSSHAYMHCLCVF
jgi:hypothetical protein